jgi:hypothetical protein
MRTLRFFAVPLFFLIGMSPLSRLAAQGRETASRPADISVFGAYSNSYTDFGKPRDNGASFGADYTRFFARLPIAPSIEIRANILNGPVVNEDSYVGGLRATLPLHKFRPYADALLGLGTIHYAVPLTPSYSGDTSTVYCFGAGIDTRVAANFDVKLDAQYQSWNFGNFGPGGTAFTLTPTIFTVGVVYHIPFGSGKQGSPRVLLP